MGRAGKLALGAVIGGLALTLMLVASLDPPKPGTPASSNPEAGVPLTSGDTLRRCRVVTIADPECTEAWEARRRHFFGSERDGS